MYGEHALTLHKACLRDTQPESLHGVAGAILLYLAEKHGEVQTVCWHDVVHCSGADIACCSSSPRTLPHVLAC